MTLLSEKGQFSEGNPYLRVELTRYRASFRMVAVPMYSGIYRN